MKKKTFAMFLIALLFICLMPFKAHAATTYYQTTKANVPIWSSASSKSTRVRTISSANTVLKVTDSKLNSSFNIWYKLSDGTWVYSGNVKKHSHTYSSGICTNNTCKYEYPHSVSSLSGEFVVTNQDGASIWSRPYSGSSIKRRVDKYGTVLKVVGKTTNLADNLWYKLSDGNWVFSGNVTQRFTIKFNANGGKNPPSTQYALKGGNLRLSATKPTRVGYVFKGWGTSSGAWFASYQPNSVYKFTENKTLYALWSKCSHSYTGGICTKCSYEYPLSISSASGVYEVTNKDGAPIVSRPYSKNSVTRRTEKKGALLTITGKVTNQPGNLWYRLSDGNWVYSGNVKKHAHDYLGGICKNAACKYEYRVNVTSCSGEFVVTNSEGAKIHSRPYSQNSIHLSTAKYNKVLTVIGKTTNQHGNLWYKINEGMWAYSGDLTQRFTVKYNANGGSKAPKAQTFLSGKTLTLSKTKPERINYIFKGWATSKNSTTVNYKTGASYSAKKSITLYAVWEKCTHKDYSNGFCKSCGYEYPLKVTSVSGTFVVTNKDGAAAWSRPYSGDSTKVTTYKKGKALTVTAKTTNEPGNLWYQLSNGNWVFSGNVKQRFTIKYNANKGSKPPASQTVLAGESLKIPTTKPTRKNYIFQGWATSASATKIQYKPGSSYNFNKDTTLYAVWSNCKHEYNYGICKKCGYSWPYEEVDITNAVYKVNNGNGSSSYNRPYDKSAEKSYTYKKNAVVVVTHKATNQKGIEWYKLKNGKWMKADDLTKQTTFNSIGAITKKDDYDAYYNYLAKGTISAQKINGAWYYTFTYNKKTIYIPVTAFSGESSSKTQLNAVSADLTEALNAHGSINVPFMFNKKTVSSLYYLNGSVNYSTHHWEIYNLTGSVATRSQNSLYTKCEFNSGIILRYTTKYLGGSSPAKPTTAKEYVYCLKRTSLKHPFGSIDPTSYVPYVIPTMSIAVEKSRSEYTKKTDRFEFLGYFDNYSLKGKGWSKGSLELDDYVSLFTSAVKITKAVYSVVDPKVAITKALYTLATDAWGMKKTGSSLKSKDFSTDPLGIAPYNKKDKKVDPVYKVDIESPIRLRYDGDYLTATYTLFKWQDDQTFKVTFSIDDKISTK